MIYISLVRFALKAASLTQSLHFSLSRVHSLACKFIHSCKFIHNSTRQIYSRAAASERRSLHETDFLHSFVAIFPSRFTSFLLWIEKRGDVVQGDLQKLIFFLHLHLFLSLSSFFRVSLRNEVFYFAMLLLLDYFYCFIACENKEN